MPLIKTDDTDDNYWRCDEDECSTRNSNEKTHCSECGKKKTAEIVEEVVKESIVWDPEGWACINPGCGYAIPNHTDKCPNCGENPFAELRGLLTLEQLNALRVVRTSRRKEKNSGLL